MALPTCDECGKRFREGYYAAGEYYCSDPCLHQHMTPRQWTLAFNRSEREGGNDCYWTEWDDDGEDE